VGTKRGFQSSHSGIETTLHGPADGLANTSNHPIVELKHETGEAWFVAVDLPIIP